MNPPEWMDPGRWHSGGTWLFDETAEADPVWGRGDEILWHTGEACMICGPTGVGKTTVTIQILLAMMGLRPATVLGYPIVGEPRKILYLAGDRPDQFRRAMRRNIDESDRAKLDKMLTVWRGPTPKDIARHPEILMEMGLEAGADVIVLDSLKDAALRLSDDDTGGGIHRSVNLALVAGIQVLVLHHQRKGQEGRKPTTIEDVYGSTWIVNGMGSVILLWGDPGASIVEMSHLKQPAGVVGPFTLEHDHLAGTTTVLRGQVDAGAFLTESGATVAEVTVQLHGPSPTEAQLKRTQRRLDRLCIEGKAHKMGMVRGGAHEGKKGSSPARYFPILHTDESQDQRTFQQTRGMSVEE